jgi:hypothetical protein
MAAVGKPKEPVLTEEPVDYMKDAPPPRPYSEAISDKHRKFLEDNKIPLED